MDTPLTREAATSRLIRHADLVPCRVAFVDCKFPGSHLKENYALIGPGVTTNPDQVIPLAEPHGFNIGAAAMPHGITNNLHIHFTAEVFVVLSGEYTFRWGSAGEDGTFTGRAGDVLSVPTWIFRGFTNTGPDDGFVYTVLGGDNTGGIIWHPSILERAAEHGLYLRRDNLLVDTATGAAKPDAADLMEPMSEAEMAKLRRWTPEQMLSRVVTAGERAFSRAALLDACLPGHASEMAPVIGHGIMQDRDAQAKIVNHHGFSLEWLRLPPGQSVSDFRIAEKQVLTVLSGAAEVVVNRGADAQGFALGPKDSYSVPGQVWRSIRNAGAEPAEILVVTAGEGRKAIEWAPEVREAAFAAGWSVDANGAIAPAALLNEYRLAAE